MLKVPHLIAELMAFVYDGCHTVTPEQYAERLRICQNCPKRISRRCGLCGCFIGIKAQARVFTCPDTPPRWPAIPLDDP